MANSPKADPKKTAETKASQKKKATNEPAKDQAGKLLFGIPVCIFIIEIVILFLTLELSTGKLDSHISTTLWQAIFIVPLHLPTFFTSGMWSLLAALTTGAFIGGLIVKKIKKGILLGVISFGLLLLLQFSLGFLFDIDALLAWYSIVASLGGDVLLDFLVSIGILVIAGAIGGALTRD
jgi:hypothetical protein